MSHMSCVKYNFVPDVIAILDDKNFTLT